MMSFAAGPHLEVEAEGGIGALDSKLFAWSPPGHGPFKEKVAAAVQTQMAQVHHRHGR
jgi:hypothetical protein